MSSSAMDDSDDDGPLLTDPTPVIKTLMAAVTASVRSSQALPGEGDFEYHSSLLSSTDTLNAVR